MKSVMAILSLLLGLMLALPAQAAPVLSESLPQIQQVPVGKARVPVWFAPRSVVPLVAVQLQFAKAGYAYDPEAKQGLAFLASQLLMEGAGTREAIAFQQILDAYAIQLSADADEDMVVVRMSTLREHADAAFSLLRDVLAAPRFDAEAIARLQAKIRNDLKRLEENPSYLAGQLWRQTVYVRHPYHKAKRGSDASISSITQADLQQFHARALNTADVQVAASGDVTGAELTRWLTPVLDAMPQAKNPQTQVPFAAPSYTPEPLSVPFKSPQTQIVFSYPSLSRDDPQFYALMVMNHILGGSSMGSRLSQAIRDKGGMSYGISTTLDTNQGSAQILGFFSTRNEKADEAFNLLQSEVRRMLREGVSEEEVADAKSYLIGTLPVQLDGTTELANFLGTLQRQKLGVDYFRQRAQELEKVRASEVNALARRLLRNNPMAVSAGMPAKPLRFIP
jgi:zinc protease